MSMIFRIHSTPPSDLKAWETRGKKLDNEALLTIDDDLVRGNSAKVATSIPNPFARMYLFETAFSVIKDANHAGNSFYHQLVSDCLDVFHLMFLMGTDNNHITFKKWHKENEITALLAKGDIEVSGKTQPHGHKLLGETLELFFNSRRFREIDEIYLIFYKNVLLGGTSPITVFFTSPNFQRELKESGQSYPPSKGADILFDDEPAALFQRDEDFRSYMYKFKKAYSDELSNNCPHLFQYLELSEEEDIRRNPSIRIHDEYNLGDFENEFDSIHINSESQEELTSGIFRIKKFSIANEKRHIENNSGFAIQPTVEYYKTYYTNDNTQVELSTPLALLSNYNGRLLYIWDTWNKDTSVNYMANIELYDRILPGTENSKYPYLTTEDFLEEMLIEMPYNLDKENFFTGFAGDFNYLLPIKKEYFNFFDFATLKYNLSITQDSESVTVSLKIPIRDNNFIEFRKRYNKSKDALKHDDPTKGFGIGLFPFYKVTDKPEINKYVVLLVDDTESDDLELSFYRFGDIVKKQPVPCTKKKRLEKTAIDAASIYYKLQGSHDNSFDIIEVSQGVCQGLIIPQFPKVQINNNTEKFNFAIDFGTSNTHISYNSDTNPAIRPFDIQKNDIQMVLLNDRDKELSNGNNLGDAFDSGFKNFFAMKFIKNREFIPSIVGENSKVKYPIRTASCESKSFSTQNPSLFGNINIGYCVDAEEKLLDHTKYTTNIKWGMETNPGGIVEQSRIQLFFEQTLWMIKNKLILNRGCLEAKIAWFAPISMQSKLRNIFADLWSNALTDVFGQNHSIELIQETESTAPYFFLKKKLNFYEASDAVNIDIGGGTTDVIFIAKSDANKTFATSFKFAANDIWGDGITHNEGIESQKNNGFYLMQKEKVENAEIKLSNQTSNYFNTIKKNPIFTSADLVSFLFKYNSEFKFTNSIMAHPTLPSLLFLHYSAIIYHISQIILDKNLEIPMYITFTGKGSEYIKNIFPTAAQNRRNTASDVDKYTSMLFNIFTGKKVPDIFNVFLQENPKEITANGGISMLHRETTPIDPEEIVHRGFLKDHAPQDLKEFDLLKVKHLDSIEKPIMDNVFRFIDILTTDEELQQFFKKHGASFNYGNENLKQKVEKYAIHSLKQIKTNVKKLSQNDDDIVDDSPFFWALKDLFYRISREIYK